MPLAARPPGHRRALGLALTRPQPRRPSPPLSLAPRRISIITDSPLRKDQLDIPYDRIRSFNAVPRCFGLWADMSIETTGGDQHVVTAIDDYENLRDYVKARIS